MQPASPQNVVRFGVFEADLAMRELRKRGRPVKLQDQPFQVLIFLLRRSGELVSREELQKALWPSDTFVEFDEGLNKAIQKLRQTLGDSAENPRFIETVPRKGYRFIAPAALCAEEAAGAGVKSDGRHRRPWSWWLITAGALLTAAVLFPRWHQPVPPGGDGDLVLTRLTNDAGLSYQPALSPDGTLVAYASDRAGHGNLDIWVQQVPRGAPARVTHTETNAYEPAFSPDGKTIAFHVDGEKGGIFVVPALGGEPRKLTGEGWRPRYSPDGTSIAYWAGLRADRSGALYVVPSAGGQPRNIPLSGKPPYGRAPVWTPDGKHLLFAVCYEYADWYVVPVNGGSAVPTGLAKMLRSRGLGTGDVLLPVPDPDAWRDDGKVAFPAQSGDSMDLWEVSISRRTWRVDGEPHRLTIGPGLHRGASASAGGRLVFASLSRRSGIWQLPLDPNRAKVTGELQRITNGAADDFSPSISQDGRRMAFESNRTGKRVLWAKELDIGTERALTDVASMENLPLISPDGAQIAYTLANVSSSRAYVIPFEGGPARKICEDCSQPFQWSADMAKILYQADDPPHVGVLDLLTGQKRPFARHVRYRVWSALLSPNGHWTWLAVQAQKADPIRAFLAPVQNGAAAETGWIPLPPGEGVRWSPDGKLLYFISRQDGFPCLYVLGFDEAGRKIGAVAAVKHFHSLQQTPLPDPAWRGVSLARDRLVLAMSELTGNIWMAEPKPASQLTSGVAFGSPLF